MRNRLVGLVFVRSSLLAFFCASVSACSSSSGATITDPGTVTLGGVSAKHGTSVLRFTATLKNTMTKALKTLDSIEVDTGAGPKKATNIRNCDAAQTAPWLLKGGASATIEFTLRSNGPDRQAVEAACVDASGKPAGQTALWEFQTFTVVATNGTDPVKLAMNGTVDDGSIWTVTASE